MGNNAICILCNDLERFKIITDNLPKLEVDLFVINDTRLGDKINELKKIYSNATFIKGSDIIESFPRHDNIDKYGLSVKLLIPAYMFKKYSYDRILLLDDDVLITDKISEFFNIYNKGACPGGLLIMYEMKGKSMSGKLINLTQDIFGINFVVGKTGRVNGGVLLFEKDNEYEKYVLEYMRSDTFTMFLQKFSSWRSCYADEIFFTGYVVKNNYPKLNSHAKLIAIKYEKFNYEIVKRCLKTKALVHIVTSHRKMDIFHGLIERGIIK